jgi:hypothetical protein
VKKRPGGKAAAVPAPQAPPAGLLARAAAAAAGLFATQPDAGLADPPAGSGEAPAPRQALEEEPESAQQEDGMELPAPAGAAKAAPKALPQRLRLNDKGAAAGNDFDLKLVEWVRCAC